MLTIIVQKLLKKFLSQYIRWVKYHKRVKSLITLKDCTAEEDDYQIHATEIKHGLRSGNSTTEEVSPSELIKQNKPIRHFIE